MRRSVMTVSMSFAVMLILVATTVAGVPPAMSYQGRLLDSGGSPVADGDYTIRFALSTEPTYDPFWYGEPMTVTTTDGLFSTLFGFDPSEVSLFRDHALLFLCVFVGEGDVLEEVLPRTLVTTSPFAFHAQHADTADYVVNSGATPSGWIDEGDVVTLETSADTVKIGSVTEPGSLYLYGPTNSASFDMSVYGDASANMPFGSISAMEMFNEAGGGFDTLSGAEYVGTSIASIMDRPMTFPTSGYALVIATAELGMFHEQGNTTSVTLGVSTHPSIFQSNQKYRWKVDNNHVTGSYYDLVTVHAFLNVAAGLNTFYLLGQREGTQGANIYEAQITVLFVPSNYRMNPTEPSAALPGTGELNQLDSGILPQDALLREMVKRETASIRAEYDARLDAIQRQMLELLGGQSTENAGK